MGRVNGPMIHVSATSGLTAFVGFTWGAEYAVVVAGGLIWLQSLVLIVVQLIESYEDRRTFAVEAVRQQRLEQISKGTEERLRSVP